MHTRYLSIGLAGLLVAVATLGAFAPATKAQGFGFTYASPGFSVGVGRGYGYGGYYGGYPYLPGPVMAAPFVLPPPVVVAPRFVPYAYPYAVPYRGPVRYGYGYRPYGPYPYRGYR